MRERTQGRTLHSHSSVTRKIYSAARLSLGARGVNMVGHGQQSTVLHLVDLARALSCNHV